ncbi:MAG: hypothetical protein LBI87_00680 [Candidatus Accumulibacter sp.]|jgi:hypothetical protein|nr:hypothetical protein [Accumulibacter sp.]
MNHTYPPPTPPHTPPWTTPAQRCKARSDRYIAQYNATESLSNKVRIVNWALNHLATHIACNIRFDMIADAKTAVARIPHSKKQEPPPGGFPVPLSTLPIVIIYPTSAICLQQPQSNP